MYPERPRLRRALPCPSTESPAGLSVPSRATIGHTLAVLCRHLVPHGTEAAAGVGGSAVLAPCHLCLSTYHVTSSVSSLSCAHQTTG